MTEGPEVARETAREAADGSRAPEEFSEFSAGERARRESVIGAMLAARDRQRPMSREEVLQARDEGRP